ncbi:MAG: rRNA maturation RNase YbeY [Pseudobdellovibrio sp.]|nr:rRNA maturation RNase YbeY [Pseudobdellovibrio sp.]
MEALVVNQSKNLTHAKKIQKHLDAVIRGLSKTKVRNQKLLKSKGITLVFLDSAQMKKINKQFRGKNKPTDVLSFAPVEPESLGELLFCLDVLKKQAKEQGHSLEHEFLYMLIHGVLHLLGYDHELSAQEEKLMFRIQDQLFETLTA